MQRSSLERRLVAGVLLLFALPTAVAGGILVVLYRRGVLADPVNLAVAVVVGFATMMAYLAWVAHGIGQTLVRSLQEIQLGAELMATVNPGHRIQVRREDELGALAEEINRMADRLGEARAGLEGEVARATGALEAERRTLSAILAALGEGVVVATPDGRVTLANPSAEALLGAPRGGLLGRSLYDYVDREKVAHFLRRLDAGLDPVERFSLEPPQGAVLEAAMTPLAAPGERASGVALVLRDVTERTRSAEARQDRLTEALQALRGPLASVRSLSESLLGGPELASAAEGQHLLEAIHAEAVRLSGLVGLMSDPARLGVALAPGHFEELAVEDLFFMALRRLAPDGVEPEGVRLRALPAVLPRLRVEAAALSRVLTLLLRVVRDLTAAAPAWLGADARGDVLLIEVGAERGASVADLETALDRPGSLEAPGDGTVREVLRRHAGEVWAFADDSRCGFRMTLLPAAAAQAAAPAGTDERARTALIGAGTASGTTAAAAEAPERPAFYDFSLFDEMDRHLQPGDRRRGLDELVYVVLDTETTGLDPRRDRVVSLAGVRVRGGVVRRGELFDALVHPGRPIPPTSTRFHGITDDRVSQAPPIDVVLPAFLRFAEGAVLVGHQVDFDLRLLEAEVTRLGGPPLVRRYPVLDTLLLSEVVHGRLPDHGLDAVAARFGVPLHGRHSALGDALTTAEIFVRLVELLRKRGVQTLGQAADVAQRARSVRAAETSAPSGARP